MAYCTQSDLVTRFGEQELRQLTDRANVGAINPDRVATAIRDAGAEIDGYLGDGGYNLPLSPVPFRLVRCACVLSRYYLYDGVRPKDVQEDYNKQVAWLDRVAEGTVKLFTETGEMTRDNPRKAVTVARSQVFTDDLFEKY